MRPPVVHGRIGRFLLVVLLAAGVVVACGDPPPTDTPSGVPDASVPPPVACLGVVASKCSEFVKQAVIDGHGVPVQAIRIVCTAPPCTERQGQVTIDILYANGLRNSSGSGWATVDGGNEGKPPPSPEPGASVPAPSA